jgi:hypothetical protein
VNKVANQMDTSQEEKERITVAALKKALKPGEDMLWHAEGAPINLGQFKVAGVILYLLAGGLPLGIGILNLVGGDLSVAIFMFVMAGILVSLLSFIFRSAAATYRIARQWHSPEELAHYVPAVALTTQHILVRDIRWVLISEKRLRQRISIGEYAQDFDLSSDILIWKINTLTQVLTKPMPPLQGWRAEAAAITLFYGGDATKPVYLTVPASKVNDFIRVLHDVRPDLVVKMLPRGPETPYGTPRHKSNGN